MNQSKYKVKYAIKSHCVKNIIILFLLIFFGTNAFTQIDSVRINSTNVFNQSYILRRGDVIDILVMEHPEFSVGNVAVLPDGCIQFPGVGSIPAAGSSIKDFNALMNKNVDKYVVNPIVSIFVRSLPTQIVNVVGYVNRPGQIPIFEPLDIITVLSKAGGIKNIKECRYITIIRADQSFEILKVKDLFSLVNNNKHIPLLNIGDTVYVVEPKDFNWSKLSFFTSVGYILISVINILVTRGVI